MARARIPAENGAMNALLVVVFESTTFATSSVLPVTRPRPGKCFSTVDTWDARIPSVKAMTCEPTVAAVEPKLRRSAPIGGLLPAVPAGTTSATGARSMLTPACFSCPPHFFVADFSQDVEWVPCASAEGIEENPEPLHGWIRPPSWSPAIHILTPRVVLVLTRARSCAVALATLEDPVQCPCRITLPTWSLLISALIVACEAPLCTLAMNSCPTRCASLIALNVRVIGPGAAPSGCALDAGAADWDFAEWVAVGACTVTVPGMNATAPTIAPHTTVAGVNCRVNLNIALLPQRTGCDMRDAESGRAVVAAYEPRPPASESTPALRGANVTFVRSMRTNVTLAQEARTIDPGAGGVGGLPS